MILALALALTAGLYAQSSSANSATAGLYGNDADDYMDLTAWSDVEFDKWFGLAGYANNMPELGFATRFGNIYTGFYYNGNIAQVNDGGRNENTTTSFDASGAKFSDTTTYAVNPKTTTSYNNFSALIGVAGMGIGLGFYEQMTSSDAPPGGYGYSVTEPAAGGTTYTVTSGGAIYDSYTDSVGVIVPSLAWGMTFNLAGLEISPAALFALGISRQKNESVSYGSYTVAANGNYSKVSSGSINNAGYLIPLFSLGADVVLSDTGAVKMSAGLNYGLTVNAYSNSYDFFGNSGKVKGSVQTGSRNAVKTALTGTFSPLGSMGPIGKGEQRSGSTYSEIVYTSLSFTEQSFSSNSITPSFTLEGEFGNLKAGFGAAIPLTFSSEKSEKSDEEYLYASNGTDSLTVTRTYTSPGSKTSGFEFAPELDLGASYALVPGRFSVNAGLRLTLPALTYSKTTGSYNDNDVNATSTSVSGSGAYSGATAASLSLSDPTPAAHPATHETETRSAGWSGAAAAVSAGFTLNFNENFAVDMLATSAGTIDLTNVNVLFTVKF
jgi:hypothetical protein